MMKKRYFKNKRTIAKAKDSLRVDLSGRLSPYDELVKKYARPVRPGLAVDYRADVPGIQIRSPSR